LNGEAEFTLIEAMLKAANLTMSSNSYAI